ncbi:hypothetical protein RI367_005850 [Sorochytrium milnesiophthora]
MICVSLLLALLLCAVAQPVAPGQSSGAQPHYCRVQTWLPQQSLSPGETYEVGIQSSTGETLVSSGVTWTLTGVMSVTAQLRNSAEGDAHLVCSYKTAGTYTDFPEQMLPGLFPLQLNDYSVQDIRQVLSNRGVRFGVEYNDKTVDVSVQIGNDKLSKTPLCSAPFSSGFNATGTTGWVDPFVNGLVSPYATAMGRDVSTTTFEVRKGSQGKPLSRILCGFSTNVAMKDVITTEIDRVKASSDDFTTYTVKQGYHVVAQSQRQRQ